MKKKATVIFTGEDGEEITEEEWKALVARTDYGSIRNSTSIVTKGAAPLATQQECGSDPASCRGDAQEGLRTRFGCPLGRAFPKSALTTSSDNGHCCFCGSILARLMFPRSVRRLRTGV
jgi:hypothetical protein